MTQEGKVKQKVKELLDRRKPDCFYGEFGRNEEMFWLPDIVGLYTRMFAIYITLSAPQATIVKDIRLASVILADCVVFTIGEGNIDEFERWLSAREEAGI